MAEQIFVPSKDKKNPEDGLTSVLDQKKMVSCKSPHKEKPRVKRQRKEETNLLT